MIRILLIAALTWPVLSGPARANWTDSLFGWTHDTSALRSIHRHFHPWSRHHRGRPTRRHVARGFSGGSVVRASFYGGGPKRFEPNTRTANGERFDQWGLTAAHRSLPFGTRLRVCFHNCVVVRITDRGPAAWTGRSLDLSRGAASRIGLIGPGTGLVRMATLR